MPDEVGIGRILVIEDEKTIAGSLLKIFLNAGYECRTYGSAELFWTRSEPDWVPDFALIDVVLPGQNGIALAILLKEIFPDTTITLFSGHIDTEKILEDAGIQGTTFRILAKPVHPTTLLELISKSLTNPGRDA